MGAVVLTVGVILMVVIHEAGHFVAAKAFNIKATQAFFGFGPRLWSMQRGETEYGIKALPLGGYVRIIGMNPLEEVDPADEGRTYREKPFWQKSVVVLAGIGSHFVIAFILFFLILMVWGREGPPTTEIASVSDVAIRPSAEPEVDPLEIFVSDVVVSIDGVPLEETSPLATKEPGAVTTVGFERNGELMQDTTTASVVVAPAYLSDVQENDVLVEFAGVPVDSWEDFVAAAHAHPGELVSGKVERAGSIVAFETVLISREFEGKTVGFFGVSPGREIESVTVVQGVGAAWSELAARTLGSVEGLGGLVTNFPSIVSGTFSSESVGVVEGRPISVIGLARIAGPLREALIWLAFVNVFVGVLNVIPLYPLDGGHFAVALYEKVRGRPADVRKLLPVAAVVFVFIVMIGLLGIYLDIVDPLQLPG
jgi:RIP metalloprotease RseP